LVDDDEAVRLSACRLLEQCGFDVESFKSGDDFLARQESRPVACVLLDMRMPGSDGFAVLHALRDRGDSPPVIVITGHGGIPEAVRAMQLGALDFIEKPYTPALLLAAIESALAGGVKSRDPRVLNNRAKALVETLSPRQREVLQGILDGRPNKIIAYELGLSIRTIEAYRAQMLAKLDVRGTAEAVRVAIAAGLLAAGAAMACLVLVPLTNAGRGMFGTRLFGADLGQMILAVA
jgi:two-component system response regulator FixJ